jgi:prepilin peptidase CpaA
MFENALTNAVLAGALAFLLLLAAASDLSERLVPNRIPAALLALFIVCCAADGRWTTLGFGLAAAVVVLALGLGAFRLGWLGGGDVKLMVAVAAWVGPAGLPEFLLGTALFGGGLALVVAARAVFAAPPLGAPALRRVELPYAVAIALGAGRPLLAAPLLKPLGVAAACVSSTFC